MLRLLIDQDFDHDILRGLERRIPELDYVTNAEMGLSKTPDPELLEWAMDNRRVLLTHDQSTMPDHIAERMSSGEDIFGVIIAPRSLSIRLTIEELELVVLGSDEKEYLNRYLYLPL